MTQQVGTEATNHKDVLLAAVQAEGKDAEAAASLVQHISDSYINDLRWEAEQPEADLNDVYEMVAHQVAEGAVEMLGLGYGITEVLRLYLVDVGEGFVREQAN